jgi:hypothetical protein
VKGFWLNENRAVVLHDVLERFEVSFESKEGFEQPIDFLGRLCLSLGEEAVYLTPGRGKFPGWQGRRLGGPDQVYDARISTASTPSSANGQYVLDDDGERVHGAYLIPEADCDLPVIVDRTRHACRNSAHRRSEPIMSEAEKGSSAQQRGEEREGHLPASCRKA